MASESGVLQRSIRDTPITILDFETTGLTPGIDRVIEIAIVRVDPGGAPQLILDSLVNPMRPVAATEIHGITDEDVADAPRFEEIAGELVAALTDSVVCAYNVYFDIKFLEYELTHVGVSQVPPHFCLMYMRPMLGMGGRCKLDEACRLCSIEYGAKHVAAEDAQASAKLLEVYLDELNKREIATFEDLARLKSYKFVKSFENRPLPSPTTFGLSRTERLRSRAGFVPQLREDPVRQAFGAYMDALKTVLADLEITPDEMKHVVNERKRLGLSKEQIRFLHARAFASVIAQFVDDQWLDDREVVKLRHLRKCLSDLGWAPGD